MRELDAVVVTEAVKEMCIEANLKLTHDIEARIENSVNTEKSRLAKKILGQLVLNMQTAKECQIPICQDTGMAVFFVKVGQDLHINGNLTDAINEGVRRGYSEGYLRKSVVKHPLDRVNTKDNTPAIVHVKLVKGDKVKIDVAPKGGGSENMSLVKILIPADGVEGIKKLVLDTVFKGGGKPCPPIIVGLGIGGNLEQSALLAKKALLREVDDVNEDPILAKLESELKEEITALGVGPMGFGGTQTCLAVKALAYPCHIASLPLAINIQCHAARHKSYIF